MTVPVADAVQRSGRLLLPASRPRLVLMPVGVDGAL